MVDQHLHQLSGLDASFLAIETANAPGHIGSVMVIDPSTRPVPLDLESFAEVLGTRMRAVPSCTRKLHGVPLGLDMPYWVDDLDFDLEYHIREIALPVPGTRKQLTEQVSRLHARPLDRTRPLWEMYLITGLEGGRAAVYTKLHHAMIDGVGGNDILEAVLDIDVAPRHVERPGDVPHAVSPTTWSMARRAAGAWAQHPVRAAGIAAQLVRSAPSYVSVNSQRIPVFRRDADERDIVLPTSLRAPAVPFNAAITPHRRLALLEIPFASVKAVKDDHGCTVNDVVLSICAGGLRRYLAGKDALPTDPLIAAVPVSVRQDVQAAGNHVSMMMVPLATDGVEPADRLVATVAAASAAKEKFQATPAPLLVELAEFSFPALGNQAGRLSARLGLLEKVRPFNLFISNVPGPRIPLFIAGAELLEYYPVSTLPDGQGLNITVFSYRDSLFFGLLGCRELVPDLEVLADGLREEMQALESCSRAGLGT